MKNMKIHSPNEKFPGFPPEPNENFWQYPKALNGFWHQLSGSEQKVLDYIVRHTWGYRKSADRISLSQFRNGIKNRKTGLWVDKGTGLKHNQTLTNALKSLEKKGFILSVKKIGKTTEYILKVVQKMNNPSSNNEQVDSAENEHTIDNVPINNYQKGFFKKKKRYYNGDPMVFHTIKKRWYVIDKNGQWLLFVGKDSETEWK